MVFGRFGKKIVLSQCVSSFGWFGFYINIMHFLKGTNFTWKTKTCEFKYSKSKFQNEAIKIAIWLHVFFCGYELYILKTELAKEQRDYNLIIFFSLLATGYLILGTSLLNIQIRGEEIVYLLNQLLHDSKTRVEGLRQGSKNGLLTPKNMERLAMRCILPVWCSTCIFLIIVFILALPKVGFLMADSIFSSRNENIFVSSALILIQGGVTFFGASSFGFFVTYSAIYILRNAFWLDHVRNEEGDLGIKLRVYNRMRILNINLNSGFISILLPVYIFAYSAVIVVGGFGGIRLYGKTSLISYFIFLLLTFACIAFNTMFLLGYALCWKHSCDTLAEIKSISPAQMKDFYRKTIFATRAYGINYGPFKAVKHSHIFDSYEAIVSYLVTFLVSVPSQAVIGHYVEEK